MTTYAAPLAPALPTFDPPSNAATTVSTRSMALNGHKLTDTTKSGRARASDHGPLSLGLDCSTQGLKAVAVTENLSVFAEINVNFDKDLPQYNTEGGVLLEDGGVVNAPVDMYISALDLLAQKMKEQRFPFERVAAISGAGQQHAMVLFSSQAAKLLASLDPAQSLASQLAPAFASPTVTNWQDSSTSEECNLLEQSLPGGRDELARITGSKAHQRFTGPQILKMVRRGDASVWNSTSKIALVSSWLATMFCLDGEIKGVDEADACGENLFDIPNRTWHSSLLQTASQSSNPSALAEKLGTVEIDPGRVVGTIGRWWVERFGFDPRCIIAPFTGDNPSTLLSFTLSPGDAVISLGTSDTVLLATNHYNPSPEWHTFSHPAGDGVDGTRRYMSMLCYKNGSLVRERIQKQLHHSDWASFNTAVVTSPPPLLTRSNSYFSALPPSSASDTSDLTTSSSTNLLTVFNYIKPEIIPENVSGIHTFRNGVLLPEPAVLDAAETADLARRCLESQFLSFRSRIKGILNGEEVKRVFVAGGGSVNEALTSLLADVMGCPVYTSTGSAQGCAIGASYRAAWALKKTTDPTASFEATIEAAKASTDVQALDRSSSSTPGTLTTAARGDEIPGMKRVGVPNQEAFEAYGRFLPEWERLEGIVVETCAERMSKLGHQ